MIIWFPGVLSDFWDSDESVIIAVIILAWISERRSVSFTHIKSLGSLHVQEVPQKSASEITHYHCPGGPVWQAEWRISSEVIVPPVHGHNRHEKWSFLYRNGSRPRPLFYTVPFDVGPTSCTIPEPTIRFVSTFTLNHLSHERGPAGPCVDNERCTDWWMTRMQTVLNAFLPCDDTLGADLYPQKTTTVNTDLEWDGNLLNLRISIGFNVSIKFNPCSHCKMITSDISLFLWTNSLFSNQSITFIV